MPDSRILGLALVAVGAAACTGNITGDPLHGPFAMGAAAAPSSAGAGGSGSLPSGSGGVSSDTMTQSFNCKAGTVDPGPSPMKLLSRSQYLNSVSDLIGSVPNLDTALGASANASAFGLVQPDVAQVDVENYGNAAKVIAASVVNTAATLATLAPCAASPVKRDCAKSFVTTFAARAYRAPLTDAADIEQHLKLFDVGAAVSYAHGIELLLQGILQAPRFLYRVEVGTGEKVSDTAVKLSPYELAARLSYSLWDTLPDAKLTQAASAGSLSSKDGVAAQLTWMLQDRKGSTLLRRFLENWMQLPALNGSVKDATLFPQWTNSTLKASMADQARAFFDDVLTNQGGKLSALITSPTVFVNKDLGGYYGMTGGDTFTSLQRSDGTVSGMLTLPAFLTLEAKTNESSPIYRGKFVREQMLCQILPAPPANIPKAPDVMPGVSTRERLKEHETNASCSGCHQLMDPIGFGFENYDAVGQYRTTDGSAPVDASGEVIGTNEIDGKFVSVAALGQKLASSEIVRQCMARQWFRFALSRFEQNVDDCSMQGLVSAFEAAGSDLNALPKAIVLSDAFVYRHPVDSEAAQ